MEKMIVKRDGSVEKFDESKIFKALKKAFIAANITFNENEVNELVSDIVKVTNGDTVSVEEIQDLVEKELMDKHYYEVAKLYIIYREKRNKLRQYRIALNNLVPSYNLNKTLKDIQREFNNPVYSLDKLYRKYESHFIYKMSEEEKLHTLINSSLELISFEAPLWSEIGARLYLVNFYKELKDNLKKYNLNDFESRINLYINKFHYDKDLLNNYTKEELKSFEKLINRTKDKLIPYNLLHRILINYLVKLGEIDYIESFQEFYLLIAMVLAKNGENKLSKVSEYYEALSKQTLSLDDPLILPILKNL